MYFYTYVNIRYRSGKNFIKIQACRSARKELHTYLSPRLALTFILTMHSSARRLTTICAESWDPLTFHQAPKEPSSSFQAWICTFQSGLTLLS